MLTLFTTFRRKRRRARIAGAIPAALIGCIVLMPKPEAYAAPERLALTVFVFAIAAAGVAIWTAARRSMCEAAIALRYHGAPKAITNTASFLLEERRLLARGMQPALVAAIGCLGLHVVSLWPQATAFAPLRPVVDLVGLGALFSPGFMLFWRRKNAINTLFLNRYLRQQARHVGFRPRRARDANRLAAELDKPPVTRVTATGFRAGGFDWELDDFWKNAVVLGQPGSGKTATALTTLLEGLIASSAKSTLPTAGLILDAKRDFKAKIIELCHRYGREKDLFILSAADWAEHARTPLAIAYNFLDSDDDGLEIAARIVTAGKIAGGIETKDTFFLDASRSYIRHAIEFLRAADPTKPPSLIDLRRLGVEFNQKKGFYIQQSKRIVARYAGAVAPPPAVSDAVAYFEDEFRQMADRQRSGLIGTITQLIDEFSVEPFREMLSGKSTLTISEAVDHGKILYVHLPTAERPRMAITVACLIKLQFQNEVLRRVDKERPSFFVCDEFPVFWTTGERQGDADFFALSRASRHANIVAAQSISAFYKRSGNKDEATNFLGNCATKIFLRNEIETNSWASRLFGMHSEINVTTNELASFNEGLKHNATTYARAISNVPVVPPEAFAALAIPVRDDPAQHYAESIVHLGTRAAIQKLDLAWRINPL